MCLGNQVMVIVQTIDKPDSKGFPGIDQFTAEDQLFRLGFADQSRQTLGATAKRDAPIRYTGESETRSA